ncbi:hypothetical protein H0H87_011367 [Tephrocybe sp. NHM501043]|nr:hypothetical protein H0H87_011367 [Tephrocybe sp. NHM501043]
MQINLITRAALALVASLKRLGYSCALCGDLACYGYGLLRVPETVEALILAFTPSEARALLAVQTQLIKQSADNSSRFFTSTHPNTNEPDVFCYVDHTIQRKSEKTCTIKLSFLCTSMTHLVREVQGVPCVPISYVILRKLEEWDASSSMSVRSTTAEAVQSMLKTVCMTDNSKLAHLDLTLFNASYERVGRFTVEHAGSASAWKTLGFAVGSSAKVLEPSALTRQGQTELIDEPTIKQSPQTPGEEDEHEQPTILNPTRTQMLLLAAQESVELLEKCGWRSVIFGSVACFLYGNPRSPNVNLLLVLWLSAILNYF